MALMNLMYGFLFGVLCGGAVGYSLAHFSSDPIRAWFWKRHNAAEPTKLFRTPRERPNFGESNFSLVTPCPRCGIVGTHHIASMITNIDTGNPWSVQRQCNNCSHTWWQK